MGSAISDCKASGLIQRQAAISAVLTLTGVVQGVEHFDAPSIIVLGLLVLIATPVARVGMCIVGFLFERDKLYVLVSTVVLGILLYSLFFHK